MELGHGNIKTTGLVIKSVMDMRFLVIEAIKGGVKMDLENLTLDEISADNVHTDKEDSKAKDIGKIVEHIKALSNPLVTEYLLNRKRNQNE
jgi:hypothetical protein